jgi:hypothetical protein
LTRADLAPGKKDSRRNDADSLLIGTLESVLAHIVGLSEHEHQLQFHKALMNDGLS